MTKEIIYKLLALINLELFLQDAKPYSLYVNDVCIFEYKRTQNAVHISYDQKKDQIKQIHLSTRNEDYLIPYENNAIHGFVKKTSFNGLVTECKFENNEKIDDFINSYWIINYERQ